MITKIIQYQYNNPRPRHTSIQSELAQGEQPESKYIVRPLEVESESGRRNAVNFAATNLKSRPHKFEALQIPILIEH